MSRQIPSAADREMCPASRLGDSSLIRQQSLEKRDDLVGASVPGVLRCRHGSVCGKSLLSVGVGEERSQRFGSVGRGVRWHQERIMVWSQHLS